MSKVVDLVKDLVERFAKECGLDVADIEYAKKNNGNNLTIYIEKEGGVTVDDCAKLHRLIDAPLDELDPTSGEAYVLNVSSCGLDKPLKSEKDYLRVIGELIEINFYVPQNNKKSLCGKLIEVYDKKVKILVDGENLEEIDLKVISSGKVIFDL